jgi:hypothetical protein
MVIDYKRRGRKRSWYNFNYLGMCQNWMRIGSTLVRITVIRNRHLQSKCQKRFPTFIEPATLYHDHSLSSDPALNQKNLVHIFAHNILYILILSSYLPFLHACGHLTQVCREKGVGPCISYSPHPEKYKNRETKSTMVLRRNHILGLLSSFVFTKSWWAGNWRNGTEELRRNIALILTKPSNARRIKHVSVPLAKSVCKKQEMFSSMFQFMYWNFPRKSKKTRIKIGFPFYCSPTGQTESHMI